MACAGTEAGAGARFDTYAKEARNFMPLATGYSSPTHLYSALVWFTSETANRFRILTHRLPLLSHAVHRLVDCFIDAGKKLAAYGINYPG